MKTTTIFVLLFLIASVTFADTSSELKKITQSIAKIEKSLLSEKSKHNQLLTALKQTDLSISRSLNALEKTKRLLREKHALMSKLKKKESQLEAELNEQKHILALQLQASYVYGKNDYLKMFLNQQNPYKANRILQYYGYIHKKRSQQINLASLTLTRIKNNKEKIKKESAELEKLKVKQSQSVEEFKRSKLERKALVSALSRNIKTKGQKLKELESNKRDLEKLLARLNKTATISSQNIRFSSLKGKLPWPTEGKLERSFNQKLPHSNLPSQGIYIATAPQATIKAIAAGKVIFADWLRGFGLLIILEHGHGYISLYAHNDTLLHQIGDMIKSGQNIATSGQSGGADKNGLYFEIRRHGKALNPKSWLGRSGS